MRVFLFDADDGYELCQPKSAEGFDDIQAAISGHPVGKWVPPPMKLIRKDMGKSLRTSHAPWLGDYVPIFREEAVAALGPILEAHGELLPFDCGGTRLWMYNVTRIVDALDEARSSVHRFDDGRIMMIDAYVFRKATLKYAHIFKIPNLDPSSVFLSDSFVKKWQAAKLKGLDFKDLGEAV